MQKSNVYKSMFGAEEAEINLIEQRIADLNAQLNIDTATWALDIYEKDLGIPVDINKPYSERRAVIKSKERGSGKVDAELLKTVADAYANGEANVDFDGKIHIRFTSILGIPENQDDLEEVVDSLRPAHLEVIFHFLYMTWGQHDAYNKMWGEWDALLLTWDQFEAYEE